MNTMAGGAAQRLVAQIGEMDLPELPQKDVVDTHLPTGVRIYGYTAEQMREYARAALAAQPSSAGQGDALEALRREYRPSMGEDILRAWAADVSAALAASQPVGISADWVLGYLTTDAPEDSREAIRNAFTEYAAISGFSQPVAVSSETLRSLADRWSYDREYKGSPVDDIRALIDAPTSASQPGE